MSNIVIEASPRALITLTLVGVEYTISAPKSTLALGLARRAREAGKDVELIWHEIEKWISFTFGKKQAKAIFARLDDPEDDLDIPHILALMEKVTEVATGNPTT